MGYDFTKLTDVEALSEAPENARVFAEVGGAVKRIPSNGLGGSDIQTVIIKSAGYDDALTGVAAAVGVATPAFTCDNMTFDEACAIMASGKPLGAVMMLYNGNFMIVPLAVEYAITSTYGTAETSGPVIIFADSLVSPSLTLVWTADGISAEK